MVIARRDFVVEHEAMKDYITKRGGVTDRVENLFEQLTDIMDCLKSHGVTKFEFDNFVGNPCQLFIPMDNILHTWEEIPENYVSSKVTKFRSYELLKDESISINTHDEMHGGEPSIGEFDTDTISETVCALLCIELLTIEKNLREEFPDYW